MGSRCSPEKSKTTNFNYLKLLKLKLLTTVIRNLKITNMIKTYINIYEAHLTMQRFISLPVHQ